MWGNIKDCFKKRWRRPGRTTVNVLTSGLRLIGGIVPSSPDVSGSTVMEVDKKKKKGDSDKSSRKTNQGCGIVCYESEKQ